jgi:protein tyrosine phosphatase (PTP) superfamily phosphohydrolase (DUF442 family)
MKRPAFPFLALLYLACSGPAAACGWWGDGELGRADDDVPSLAEDGAPAIPAGRRAALLPGGEGYGIAVFRPDLAVPYLRATGGRSLTRIGELRVAGFAAVIDLGTPVAEAARHRAESAEAGMRYTSIPVVGTLPAAGDVTLFSGLVGDPGNRPLLVYAPDSGLLAAMWALHRLGQGAPRGTALGEAQAFGAAPEDLPAGQ